MTADEILDAMKTALKEFGEYSFSDKGAREVMDLDEIVQKLNAMPPVEVIVVLETVYAAKAKRKFAQQLVEELVCSMDGTDDVRWAELMKSEVLQSCYG